MQYKNKFDTTATRQKRFWRNPETIISTCLVGVGLLLNYVAEVHGFIPLGVHPPGNTWGGLPDIFIPIAAFYLTLGGLILLPFGLRRQDSARFSTSLMVSIITSLVLTAFYAYFFYGIQFLATGADRLGECPGLDAAAAASHEIPQSIVVPGHPAVGCSVQRYGMFLSFYNQVAVSGVIDQASQDRILKSLSDYSKAADTRPIRVLFYEKENWTTWRNEKNGASGGQRGPENIIRVVTIR
jgi:hypothetical protein